MNKQKNKNNRHRKIKNKGINKIKMNNRLNKIFNNLKKLLIMINKVKTQI